jgi:hypothetical protein
VAKKLPHSHVSRAKRGALEAAVLFLRLGYLLLHLGVGLSAVSVLPRATKQGGLRLKWFRRQ